MAAQEDSLLSPITAAADRSESTTLLVAKVPVCLECFNRPLRMAPALLPLPCTDRPGYIHICTYLWSLCLTKVVMVKTCMYIAYTCTYCVYICAYTVHGYHILYAYTTTVYAALHTHLYCLWHRYVLCYSTGLDHCVHTRIYLENTP
jgi:hypothetical protein